MGKVEPSADLRAIAHFLMEMYQALLGEGFTEKQALVLLGQTLTAGIQKPSE